MSNYGTNTWGSNGGSGVQTMINGKWVEPNSPEAISQNAQMRKSQNDFKKLQVSAFKSQIQGQTDLDKSKAIIEATDSAKKTAEAVAAQRVNSAANAETRGMSRRVHRRRGSSAFGAMAALAKANLEETKGQISSYFDQSAKHQIDSAARNRRIIEARTNMLRNTVIR